MVIQEICESHQQNTFGDGAYDKTFQVEGTTVHIIAPQITEEEKSRRLSDINSVIRILWNKNHKNSVGDRYITENTDRVHSPN